MLHPAFTPTKILIYVLVITLIGTGVYFLTIKQIESNTMKPEGVGVQPNETIKEEKFTIIAFGDSLTAGYGVSLEESYPALLERELVRSNKNIEVINMGVSGETTTGSLDRVDFILSQKPSLVLLALGANDMLRASSPKIAKENLRIILQRLQQEGVSVVLLGMRSTASNGLDYVEAFDDIYPSLAKEYGIPLVPFFLEGVALNPSLNNSDGIHPNKNGYEKIVKENILPVLLLVLKDKGL